jgi:hypothetical protein
MFGNLFYHKSGVGSNTTFRQLKGEMKQRFMANFVLGELIYVLLITALHYSQDHVKVPSV